MFQKLSVAQLIKEPFAFYEHVRFITTFISPHRAVMKSASIFKPCFIH